MILMSLAACVGAAILLCFLAATSKIGLYAGTACLGFFISWQFGACFSWVAKKVQHNGKGLFNILHRMRLRQPGHPTPGRLLFYHLGSYVHYSVDSRLLPRPVCSLPCSLVFGEAPCSRRHILLPGTALAPSTIIASIN